MNKNSDYRMGFKIPLLVVVGIVVGVIGVLTFQYFKGPKQTVSIVGNGEVEAPADSVNLNINITNTSWSQKQAEADNKIAVDKIKKQLLALGIPESRMTQSSYSDSYTPPIPDVKLSLDGGTAYPGGEGAMSSNPRSVTDLTIELDSIKGIEKVYVVISSNPNAKLSNTSYFLKKRANFESKARELALEDARKQVEVIAKINKLKVGKLVSIQSTNLSEPFPVNEKGMMVPEGTGGDAQTSISYSEQTIKVTASYNVHYELN